jgi:hypothetical protein
METITKKNNTIPYNPKRIKYGENTIHHEYVANPNTLAVKRIRKHAVQTYPLKLTLYF